MRQETPSTTRWWATRKSRSPPGPSAKRAARKSGRRGGSGAEEPALDGGERHVALDRPLLRRGGGERRREGGDGGDRLLLEDLARGDDPARLPRPRHHLDGEDRVAAQAEEAVVDADPL